MKFKSIFLLVLMVVFTASTFITEANTSIDPMTRTLLFIDEQGEHAINHIQSNRQEKSYGEINKQLNTNKLKVIPTKVNKLDQYKDFTDIAINVDQVSSNANLMNTLKKLKKEGKKIYLFGKNVTPKQFESLVGFDNSIEVLDQAMTTEEIERRKREKLEKPRQLLLPENYQVIGFNFGTGSKNPLMLSSIEGENPTLQSHMYLNAVLSSIAREMQKVDDIKIQESASFYFSPDYTTYFYTAGGSLVGSDNTNYELLKDTSETISDYDYITLKDLSQIKTYDTLVNELEVLVVDHDVPYDVDNLIDWAPKDTVDQTLVQISLPWGISYQFTNSGAISIDDISDRELDFGRWLINESDIPDTLNFVPSIQVHSSGSLVLLDIRRDYNFYRYGYNEDVFDSIWIPVQYDY